MSAEKIAKKNLTQIGFKKWKNLMSQIEKIQRRQETLSAETYALNHRQGVLMTEMQKLWKYEGQKK
jgi:hypothetical protein